MLSAIKSGAGKTTITCGLLVALKKKGLRPSAFKCGPDYIDPLFHREIIGAAGGNLDLFFADTDIAKQLFCEYSKDTEISVVEGVMGFYDGIAGVTEEASAHHVSKELDIPVILVIDVKGVSLTICSIINGLKNFKDNNIKGVILNNCSKMMYEMYRGMIEDHCNLVVFGYVPYQKAYSIESRYLGLVTSKEIDNLKGKLDILAETMLETVDMDGIIALANDTSPIEYKETEIKPITDERVNIAIAKDKAFCFYYRENIDLLKKLGANIYYFSPLEDSALPEDIQGLYIGGGYPELYLKKLSENKTMKEDIKKAIENGLPTFAECGGFMYLQQEIDGHDMVGAINGISHKREKLSRFGYITVTATEDVLLGEKGTSVKGHEFHYYDSDNNGNVWEARKPKTGKNWEAGVAHKNLLCGYPHLYFYSNIEATKQFIIKCMEYDKK